MNLLTMIACASAFASYMTAPINNYNTTAIKNITNSKIQSNISVGVNKTNNNASIYNITTSIPSIITIKSITNIRCYYINNTSYIKYANDIKKNLLNSMYFLKTKRIHLTEEQCNPNVEGCYIQMLWYKYLPYLFYNHIYGRCRYNNTKEKKFTNTNWFLQFLDYDSHDNINFFYIEDYCKGDLCNSPDLKNFPNAKKLLSIKARNPTQHNELCPGYSKNYRKINLYVRKVQQISVAEGANLILLASGIESQWPSSYSRPPYYYNSPYDKTEWTLATLEDPDNDMPFISFDKNNNVIAYDIPHNLIANNKTFYLSPKSIHICNFTKEDQGILKHIDKFQNNKTYQYEVKIIVRKEPTTIPTTTKEPTTTPTTTKEPTTISTTKGDYKSSSIFSSNITQQVLTRIKTTDYTLLLLSSTKNASYKNINTYKPSHNENDNIKYIAGSVASGLILVIVTITFYCVIKYKKGKQHAINTKNEFMLIPLK